MKSGNRDKAEGKLHQVKGQLKEAVGKFAGDKDLKVEGQVENATGKIQEKRGEIKKVLEK